MSKKVLVTGASGFIGKHLIKLLVQKNYSVVASARSIPVGFRQEAIPLVWKPYDFNWPIEWNLFDYFEKPDILIHLAWEGLPNYDSNFHLTQNLPKQQLFLESLIKGGLKSVTVAGTCMEYGLQEGELSEDMPVNPISGYAEAKDRLRRTLEDWQTQYGFQLNWVRLFYMYGEGQNPKSLHSQLMHAIESGAKSFDMSPGDQIRDFLPVESVVEKLLAIAVQNKIHGIINCCSGTPISVEDFVVKTLEEQGVIMQLNKGAYGYSKLEPKNFWGSTKKLETIFKNGSN